MPPSHAPPLRATTPGSFVLNVHSDIMLTLTGGKNIAHQNDPEVDADVEEILKLSEAEDDEVVDGEELNEMKETFAKAGRRHDKVELEEEIAKYCKNHNKKWEDPDFPADGSSLYLNPSNPPEGAMPPKFVKWLRPEEFCTSPQMFCDGVSAGDVVQGALSDCWILSALSILATKPKLLTKLIVSERCKAQGIYVMQFFKNGQWQTVMIDDRIPCDASRFPIYARSKDPDEIWVMLVEKAYAKLHRCYEALSGGQTDYGLRDITGGIPYGFHLAPPGERNDALHDALLDVSDYAVRGHKFLLGCAIVDDGRYEHAVGQGLLANHAYSILQLKLIDTNGDGKEDRLLQIRNPWGQGEWTGAWSDGWDGWTDTFKAQLKYVDEDDGTFWMSLEDFEKCFTNIYLCDIIPNWWHKLKFRGEWKGVTAGGCMNFKDTWHDNPYFRVTVSMVTEVIIMLTQEDARMTKGKLANTYENSIGFVVYKSADGQPKKKLKKKHLVGTSGCTLRLHSSVLALLLPICIMPM